MRYDKRVIVAIAVLMVVAGIGWNWYDVKIFLNWVLAAKQLSIVRIYEAYELYGPQYRAVYPPLPILIFVATDSVASEFLHSAYSALIYVSSRAVGALLAFTERFLLKLPIVIPVIVLSLILARTYGRREIAYWLMLGIPTLVTIGTYQFDSLVALFLALSILCLTKWRRPRLSALFLALATLTKPLAAVFYLPIALYLSSWRKALQYLALVAVTVIACIAPFLIIEPKAFIANVIGFHMGRPPQYLSLWNVPVLLTFRSPSVETFVDRAWIAGYVLGVALVLAFLRPKPGNEPSLLASVVALGIVTTFLNKVVNPNYLMWVYPEALILSFACSCRQLGKLYNVYAGVGTLWPALYVTIPALAGVPMYVEEARSYVSARHLLLESLSPPLNKTFEKVFRLLDASKLHTYTLALYHNLYVVGSIMICAYAALGMYIILSLVRRFGRA